MGDTTTPIYGLIKPEVGGSRSTWGNKWNTNADTLDSHLNFLAEAINTLNSQVATLQSQVAAAQDQGAPTGAVFPWPTGDHPSPPGYIDCNGQGVAIATFPKLFAILGTRYGGDGVTTFGVPDFRGCVLSGVDEGTGRLGGLITPDTPGVLGGAPWVVLTEGMMPAHQHSGSTDTQGDHVHSYQRSDIPAGAGFAIGSGVQLQENIVATGNAGAHAHNFNTDFAGGGAGHPNLQVTALVIWIIKGY